MATELTGREVLPPPLAFEAPLVAVIGPELEDQAFPFQRGLAFAEDVFRLVVPLKIKVYEILVDASVQRSVL
ncbi:MAG TPA: hypothetical protein VKA20_02590 [Rubrobacter sp.]|nr:hypothetical protein [Rubrobacter sp.]